jgi:hypothetical protein
MGRSKVFIFEYERGKNALLAMEELFHRAGIDRVFSPGESVAIKIHPGELGNVTYLRPIFVHKVVELVKGAGGKPFVVDTTTIYPGGRNTAQGQLEVMAANGFTSGTIGAPIIIADGTDGFEGEGIPLPSKVREVPFSEIEVASAFIQADAMIVLSHFKGHELSGIGGAIKQLAMGCTTKRGKRAQHRATSPILDEEKCNGCGICAEACIYGALKMEDEKPVKDWERCFHCSECLFRCPQGAWRWEKGAKEGFQVNLAHAALAVCRVFQEGKIGFLNFVQDLTSLCDCTPLAGKPVLSDVGILASVDAVAIDKASLDLIDEAPALQPLDVSPPDIMGKLNGTQSTLQMEIAEELGLGSLSYELERI